MQRLDPNAVYRKDRRKQNSALSQSTYKKTVAKSARDARSVRQGRDTNSLSTSIGSSWSSSENTEVELAVDEQILHSGPYVAHYREMVLKSMKDGHSATPLDPPPGTELEKKELTPPKEPSEQMQSKSSSWTSAELPVAEAPVGSSSVEASPEVAPNAACFIEHQGCDIKAIEELCQACEEGNIKWAKYLVEKHEMQPADLDRCAGRKQQPALHYAIRYGRLDMVCWLLELGASATACDSQGRTPLSRAITRHLDDGVSLDMARRLIEGGAKVVKMGHQFFMAVSTRRAELVELLIQQGIDCNELFVGQPILGIAVSKGYVDIVSLLVREGKAKIDLPSEDGTSPLLIAVRKTHMSMISALLETEHKPSEYNVGILTVASRKGSPAVVQQLLDWGMPVNSRSGRMTFDSSQHKDRYWFSSMTIDNFQSLHVAARMSAALTRLLLSAGADVSGTAHCRFHESWDREDENVFGVTPLHLAASEMAEILITEGKADVFAKDSHGRTPLFWAATELVLLSVDLNIQAVQSNLAHGSPVNLRDNKGYTPLSAVALKMRKGLKTLETSDVKTRYYLIAHELLKAGAKADVLVNNEARETIKDVFVTISKSTVLRKVLKEEHYEVFKDLDISVAQS